MPQLPEPRGTPHEETEPMLVVQPLRVEPDLVARPGGGPRDFGALQSSEVTAVDGLRSPNVPLEVGSLI